jgi:DNA repair protein RecN (Recombination protein N)
MLTALRIVHFALIDELYLEFPSGLLVLTGETGAGKSIIVDALSLLVGGRGTAEVIRSDAEEASVEGVFLLPAASPLLLPLREQGVLAADSRELIIRRTLSRLGRHRIFLNGILTPLHLLQTLAGTLIDIHGQHEQQSLLHPAVQLESIDLFGRLEGVSKAYRLAYSTWTSVKAALDALQQELAQQQGREDLVRFQLQELDAAQLLPDEEPALEAEFKRLSHIQRLMGIQQEAYESLYGGDEAILSRLAGLHHQLHELAEIDQEMREWPAQVEHATVSLKDLAQALRTYGRSLEDRPESLQSTGERLDVIRRLKGKYGRSLPDLVAYRDQLRAQVEQLETGGERVQELESILACARTALQDQARALGQRRRTAAKEFQARVIEELQALQMQETRFEIGIDTEDHCGETGCDRVEYQFSANPGEPLRPLAAVASGGELSRAMLAIKTVLADRDGVPVLVFDEIDAGVGGTTATVMARKLKALGRYHQVFCVTHLPQVASHATEHYVVEKTVVNARTITQARRLTPLERKEAIARMLGGLTLTAAVKQTAADLLREGARLAPDSSPSEK